jgi:hypothetical protein
MKHVTVTKAGILVKPVHYDQEEKEDGHYFPVFVSKSALQRVEAIYTRHNKVYHNPHHWVTLVIAPPNANTTFVGGQTAVGGAGLLCGGGASTRMPDVETETIINIDCHNKNAGEVMAEIAEAIGEVTT